MDAEPLTIESLARSIHEDQQSAAITVDGFRREPTNTAWLPWGQLSDRQKRIRREQARLMLARWMR